MRPEQKQEQVRVKVCLYITDQAEEERVCGSSRGLTCGGRATAECRAQRPTERHAWDHMRDPLTQHEACLSTHARVGEVKVLQAFVYCQHLAQPHLRVYSEGFRILFLHRLSIPLIAALNLSGERLQPVTLHPSKCTLSENPNSESHNNNPMHGCALHQFCQKNGGKAGWLGWHWKWLPQWCQRQSV